MLRRFYEESGHAYVEEEEVSSLIFKFLENVEQITEVNH